MNNEEIICIEIGLDVDTKGLVKKENFTTNKNYAGHSSFGIPVYYNSRLDKKEIKKIMKNEFKKLEDGKYSAKVEQVIRKHPNEDLNKEVVSIELSVNGKEDLYYVNFCVKGYSELQQQIANEQIQEIIKDFGVMVIEEIAGKEVVLTAKTNPKGYSNMYISPKKEFFNWETFEGFKYTDKVNLPCIIKKFYMKENKAVFVVEVSINGKTNLEYVVYDFGFKFGKDNFDKTLSKLGKTIDDADKELNAKGKLVVKKVIKGKTFFNKSLMVDSNDNLFTLSKEII